MKKPILYVIIAVVVIVLIALFAMRGGSGTTGGNASSTTEGGAGGSSSLKELFAKGGSQECTFEVADNGEVRSSGTVFVTSGHMRGDFTAKTSAGSVGSHMITDGTTSYVWSDGSAQGVQMSFANMDTQGSKPSTQQGAVDPDMKTDYSCKRWSPDDSKFSLPASVTFTDLSALVPGAAAGAGASGGAGAGGAAPSCAQCNAITDANAKAQCRVALKCQ